MSKVICVDVGGTRIKIAKIPADASEAVACFPRLKIQADLWDASRDSKRLANIIADRIRPLITEGPPVARTIISLPGGVSADGKRYTGWLKHHGVGDGFLPQLANLSGVSPSSICMVHDSYVWANGAGTWCRLERHGIRGAIGVLAIGTGVAFGIVTPAHLAVRELMSANYNFRELLRHAGSTNQNVHDHIGRMYFDWRSTQGWPHDRELSDQTKRLRLLLDELGRKHDFDRILIGGGYAEQYVAGASAFPKVEWLVRSRLPFDPNFIPMLGMLG